MKIKEIKILGAITFMALCLCTGCGKTVTNEQQELANFSSAMSSFTQNINEANDKINNLDTTKDGASKELLTILEGIDDEIEKIAELPTPEQYISVKQLATESHEQMANALSYFHSAYDSETFIKQDADIAYEYYTRAMKRIRAIGYVLSGEMPEEQEGMSFHEGENDSNFLDILLQE